MAPYIAHFWTNTCSHVSEKGSVFRVHAAYVGHKGTDSAASVYIPGHPGVSGINSGWLILPLI